MKVQMIRDKVRSFVADNRAQGASGAAVSLVVSLVVGSLMAAYLLPMAINEIMAIDTAGWGDGAAALWELLPVMIVLAIFLYFVNEAIQTADF